MKVSDYKLWNDCKDEEGYPSTQIWLAQTGITTKEFGFGLPPKFPYQCFQDEAEAIGPDCCPGMLLEHNIKIEQYNEGKEQEHEKELKKLLALQRVEYFYKRTWIDSEKVYLARYEFTLLEKRKKVKKHG